MNFRADINGLRAFAVLAVVLFHFNPSWAPGGFVGVDVFFVISGFLMTSIIYRGLENNNFSIIKFYQARANRILPALSVVCLVLIVFGWFYLAPKDYRLLGKHIVGSAGFFSNFIYLSESGYFDAESYGKWLLHTWSLSVEWQFYMIYPIVLSLLSKVLSLRNICRVLVIATLISFVLSVIVTYQCPTYAYYLLPIRAWQMMAGGLAFLYPLKYVQSSFKKYIDLIGIGLILSSCIFISKEDAWPGYLALVPVFGTWLILFSDFESSILGKSVTIQKIGDWSYSIYLWHWPLVVLGHYFKINSWNWIGVLFSVFLGYLSHKFIEPIGSTTFSNISIGKVFASKSTNMILVAGIAGFTIYYIEGYNSNQDITYYESKISYPRYCHFDGNNTFDINCKVGDKSVEPIGLIWGDSYAGALDPFVNNIFVHDSAVSRTSSGCLALLPEDRFLGSFQNECKQIRETTKREVSAHKYDVIFIAGRWEIYESAYGEAYLDEVFNTIDFASKNSKQVYVFEQPIHYEGNVRQQFLSQVVRGITFNKLTRDDKHALSVNQKLKRIFDRKNYSNVHYVDRDTLYGGTFHDDFTAEGLPYTYDYGHLSEIGSITMSENFKKTALYKLLSEYLN